MRLCSCLQKAHPSLCLSRLRHSGQLTDFLPPVRSREKTFKHSAQTSYSMTGVEAGAGGECRRYLSNASNSRTHPAPSLKPSREYP